MCAVVNESRKGRKVVKMGEAKSQEWVRERERVC